MVEKLDLTPVEQLIHGLTAISDAIVIRAMHPGQGGTNHGDERRQSFRKALWQRDNDSCVLWSELTGELRREPTFAAEKHNWPNR